MVKKNSKTKAPATGKANSKKEKTSLLESSDELKEIAGETDGEKEKIDDGSLFGADSVKRYLKEMGSVTLLKRDGEVRVAKSIEEGRCGLINEFLRSELIIFEIKCIKINLESRAKKEKTDKGGEPAVPCVELDLPVFAEQDREKVIENIDEALGLYEALSSEK
ncbi:MAG: sigma-70 factor domain-containing protein, partial [Thermodesulfobacteriota bacterium]